MWNRLLKTDKGLNMFIQYRFGATRFVVLVGNIAIKFPRPRPLYVLIRFARHVRNKEVKKRLLGHGQTPTIGAMRYLFGGIVTNWNEHRVWKNHAHDILVPTWFSLFGLVNIQKRGAEVDQQELDLRNPFLPYLDRMDLELSRDLTNSRNFCRLNRRIRIHTYGSDKCLHFLSRLYKEDAREGRTIVILGGSTC